MRARAVLSGLVLVAILAPVSLLAQEPPQPQPRMGSGMMGHDMGPRMMGPGMMGGGMGAGPMSCGMGPDSGCCRMGGGMMQGMLMGPGGGMMRGMGRGMMGGGMLMGPGPGGAMGMMAQLNLDDAQRSEVLRIGDELRRKNWDLAGKQLDEQARLRDAYLAPGKRDRAAIVAAYKRIAELRVQRIANGLEAAEKIEAVLTPEQRTTFRQHGPWWMAPDEP